MSTSPWYQLCTLRDDVRAGKLTLAEFAADLNGVRTGEAPPVYGEPGMFFARTYPTYRMKELARDVLQRLAGQGGKPVLQLQVAYGGGKTHTLIALLHLAERGDQFAAGDSPESHTVRELLTFAGLPGSPPARVALLPFDQFDVIEGLEVYGPGGTTRRVKTPWGALAYQLAGDAGYTRLLSHDETFTVPAEPLLVDLLKVPLNDGLGALVLVDEAVWYYRELVLHNPRMFGVMKDFYQVLTQAVAKADRAALVASLIASKMEASDQTGVQCLGALEDIFGRIAEPVEPVAREDVAEILRRRLFGQVAGGAERRPAVDAVMAAMQRLPLRDAQRDEGSYDRLLESYPFHPDLIEVLYQKWTQMSGFQRTRGALRLLAYALRDSEGRDPAPIVGPGALLPTGGESGQHDERGLSAALNELVKICTERERWTPIINGELEKARQVQTRLPTLAQREVEQAVVATFLHSQPTGQRAQPSELLALLAHPAIDPAAVEEGLNKWRGLSWFLVEDPAVWQLGTTPNLTHIHVQAMGQLTEAEIDDELRSRIQRVAPLAAADVDVEVHKLPRSPQDVSDNLSLHYLILGPECALEPGKPLPAEVEAYFDEITGPNNPRTYRNNILALAPEISRLAGLREQVRRWLGWQRIERGDTFKLLTDLQKRELPRQKREAENGLPEAVVAAYNLLLATDEDGRVRARTLPSGAAVGQTPFERIKAALSDEERLLTTTLDPDLILPGSYLAIWREGETARRVTDLMAAFGQFPRLPRLLRPAALYDTLARGVREGVLVLRLPRADGSARTWWLVPPDEDTLRRPELGVQPAGLAELYNLETEHLLPEKIASLWPSPSGPLSLKAARQFFDGSRAPLLASSEVLDAAVRSAVERGSLMARLGGRSLYRESLPAGRLSDQLELLPPPEPLRGADLTQQAVPQAWADGPASLGGMIEALTDQKGYQLPWTLISGAVEEALSLRLFERDPDGGPWPCSPAAADQVRFRLVEEIHLTPETVVAALEYTGGATPTLRSIKETIEQQFLGREVPADLFLAAVQSAVGSGTIVEADDWRTLESAPDKLGVRVRLPAVALLAEATLNPMALQRLAEQVDQLLTVAPELALSFRVTLTAEGQRPTVETLERLNELLEKIQAGWTLS